VEEKMAFSVREINLGCSAIDDGEGRTVAFVTPQGWVDWLLRQPDQPGGRLDSIDKETHLGNVRGMKFNLHVQQPTTKLIGVPAIQVAGQGHKVIVSAQSASPDGGLRADYRAELGLSDVTGRYEWSLVSRMENTTRAPLNLPWMEYNNILPADTGGRFLCERRKQFDRCLIEDKSGVIWDMPHQHVLDYWLIGRPGQKKIPLQFRGAVGNWGGFFGEAFNPVVTVDFCEGEPCWGICDAYYDFHCCMRPFAALAPGEAWNWRYRIHWLDAVQAKPLQEKARRIPVSEADWRDRSGARLGLGFNDFRKSVQLDGVDEGSAFIPDGRERFWEKSGGPDDHGIVKLVSKHDGERVWPAAVIGPTQVPPSSRLRISGKMRVEGAGYLFFRLRPHVFQWQPEPHVDWLPVICSEPIGDTVGRWVEFTVPEFVRTPQERDTELGIELVMNGPGTGSMSGLDVVLDDVAVSIH
jgi:hypothetical protein